IAGSGELAGSADGAGQDARFSSPQGIWSDTTNLYVADTGNNTIRRIRIATGQVTTIAGSPELSGGIDGEGPAATFKAPSGLWGDGINLYIADGNSKIRKLELSTGRVTTIFAGGAPDYGSLWHTLWGDGEHLYFPTRRDTVVNRLTLADGTVSTFVDLAMVFKNEVPANIRIVPYGIWGDGAYLYFSVQFWDQRSSTLFKLSLL